MSEANEAIVSRIQKLLALAANNSNEAEASAAAAKAQEMLERYNLDVAAIGRTASGRPRKDQKQKGGLYGWQRKLWQAVAELNFCTYWSIKGTAAGSTYEHRILGSHANVVGTEHMADYLQKAIERLAQAWAKEEGYKSVFVREAIAYREGMASRITERLSALRADKVRAAKEHREAEAARAKHPGYAASGALTILDVQEDEADLNNDHVCGWEPGTTSSKRRVAAAQQAAREAEWARQRQERAEWELANPEQAAAERAATDKANEEWLAAYYKKQGKSRSRSSTSSGPRYRKATPEEERAQMGAYREGRAKGNEVGLDTQIDKNNTKGIR